MEEVLPDNSRRYLQWLYLAPNEARTLTQSHWEMRVMCWGYRGGEPETLIQARFCISLPNGELYHVKCTSSFKRIRGAGGFSEQLAQAAFN
jgi:hypothetical protein